MDIFLTTINTNTINTVILGFLEDESRRKHRIKVTIFRNTNDQYQYVSHTRLWYTI